MSETTRAARSVTGVKNPGISRETARTPAEGITIALPVGLAMIVAALSLLTPQTRYARRRGTRNRQGSTQMAGNMNTRASTRSKTTKWWNVPASKLPADETLHTDYDDCAKMQPL
ncbi:hypothetical protein Bbelb_186610 [Branchiostoma belcheri]|nr:hypothetical protein Bbelb_186610 [Branchiostoma belcheri]